MQINCNFEDRSRRLFATATFSSEEKALMMYDWIGVTTFGPVHWVAAVSGPVHWLAFLALVAFAIYPIGIIRQSPATGPTNTGVI
jgi:hypothetical protein